MHRQTDGGPQGLSTAVEASDLYMLEFDRVYLLLLKDLGIAILLYLKYVDDSTIALPLKKPGWYFDQANKVMKYEATHPYAAMEADRRTTLVLRDIANTVDCNLKFTID